MFVKNNYQALKFSREAHSAGVQFIVQSAASSRESKCRHRALIAAEEISATENAVRATKSVPNAILSEWRDGRVHLAMCWGI